MQQLERVDVAADRSPDPCSVALPAVRRRRVHSAVRRPLVSAGLVDRGMLAATGENSQFEAALGGSTGWCGIGPHPHDAVSPVSFASQVRTPALILHGAEDTNVPLGQAVYFHPGPAPLRRRARVRSNA